VFERADLSAAHRVTQESLSLRERMTLVLERLSGRGFTPFVELFDFAEGRPGVVVTFLAILELIKTSVLELVQAEPFGSIHVRARGGADEPVVATADAPAAS
jgi:segregation and condensation protein A